MRPSRHKTLSLAALVSALLVSAGPTVPGPAHATVPGSPVRSCAGLTELTFTDGTRVTSAEETTTAPAICQVVLVVPESITIKVSLPVADWNGRFQGVGGGGYAGSVSFPDDAARAGYAAAATDTGHTGSGGDWAWSPTVMKWNLIEDFASRSLHELTVKGKAVTQAYYRQAPAYAYWNGCSTGGRQGLMEAQRYPDDYDGIVSAAPAINWDRFIPAELWPQIVMREAGTVIPACKAQAFNEAAMAACDRADGVTDNVLDPQACHFDPVRLIGKQTACGPITAKDAAVMKKIWQGPRRKNGSFLWYGLTPGTDLRALAGSDAAGRQQPFTISADWFAYWLAKDPAFDWRSVTTANFADFFEQSRREYHDVIGTDDPDLRRFRASGGKLIIWHGWADSLIFPQGSIDYYERVVKKMGGLQRAEQFARLFMAPGVDHCWGGSGATPIDPLAAVVAWVEQGKAPDSLPGQSTSGMTRPVCSWPEVPRYKGRGSTTEATSFRCSSRY